MSTKYDVVTDEHRDETDEAYLLNQEEARLIVSFLRAVDDELEWCAGTSSELLAIADRIDAAIEPTRRP